MQPFSTLDRLFYIDDSGDPSSGLAVFGWVEFRPDRWQQVLSAWLEHRKRLWRECGIPVTREFHMVEYVHGRGKISERVPRAFTAANGTALWKDLGREIARETLATMSSMEGLRVGAVFRRGDRTTWSELRTELYRDLLGRFKGELAATSSLALIFMDGDGSDRIFHRVHRALPRESRRIIEDPIYTSSHSSQIMQMADHVAWCANAAVAGADKYSFASTWYADFHATRDTAREPIES